MFPGFLVGLFGGMAAAKLAHACRSRGGCGTGFRDGCHGDDARRGCDGDDARRGFRGPWGGPFGGRPPLFHLIHDLNLSRDQWHQVHDILHDLRDTFAQGRADMRASVNPLLGVLAAESFDAAAAETVARGHDATYGRVRGAALTALGRLHAILTPDQRARLRDLLAQRQ